MYNSWLSEWWLAIHSSMWISLGPADRLAQPLPLYSLALTCHVRVYLAFLLLLQMWFLRYPATFRFRYSLEPINSSTAMSFLSATPYSIELRRGPGFLSRYQSKGYLLNLCLFWTSLSNFFLNTYYAARYLFLIHFYCLNSIINQQLINSICSAIPLNFVL